MPATDHMMSADDPDNPQNWPLYKKIYVSAVAFTFAWVVSVLSHESCPTQC